MTVASVVGGIVYYIFYPILTIINWSIILLSPVVHLGSYIAHVLLLPMRLLDRFEVQRGISVQRICADRSQTIYIFFGVASLIGIAAGSSLYIVSRVLASLLGIGTAPQGSGRTAASVRAEREQKKGRSAHGHVTLAHAQTHQVKINNAVQINRKYVEWLAKDKDRRKEGLLSETILEEDDNSDDF